MDENSGMSDFVSLLLKIMACETPVGLSELARISDSVRSDLRIRDNTSESLYFDRLSSAAFSLLELNYGLPNEVNRDSASEIIGEGIRKYKR